LSVFKRVSKSKPPRAQKPEELLKISRKYTLRKGKGYVVEDPQGAVSYDVLVNLLSTEEAGERLNGYIISRQHPAQIRDKFGLENTPITWLATQTGENVLDPTSLGMLAHCVMDFFSRTRNGVVLLDGVEYLITNNDFKRVARVLEQMNDSVMQHKGYLIIPIDPRAFDSKELAIIERDFEKVSPESGMAGSHEVKRT
jgi:hypothetical protein